MLLYHRTPHGDTILAEGFKDAEGSYGTSRLWRGVWVSAGDAVTANEGAEGEDVVVVEISEATVSEFEWVEEGKPYREFLVPAAILNTGRVRRAI
jgi:hypothetical protein